MTIKSPEDAVDVYLNTIERLEPDLHPVDQEAALASIAISLRRIADAQEEMLILCKMANGIKP